MEATQLAALMEGLGREALAAAAVLARTQSAQKDAALRPRAPPGRDAGLILEANGRDMVAAQHARVSDAQFSIACDLMARAWKPSRGAARR